jgi:hypothetical protein
MIGVTMVVAVAWNGINFLVALRSRAQSAVLGLQPLFMPVAVFATFFTPTSFMPDASALVTGLGAFALIGAATCGLAARAFTGLTAVD